MGKKKKLSTTAIVLIVAAAILVILFAIAAAFAIHIGTTDSIYPNVYIAGTNVGGMTREEAAEVLDQRIEQLYGSSTLTVELPDRTIEFPPELVGATLNAEEAVTSAWEFGRYGGLFSRVSTYLKARRSEVAFTVNAGLSLDEEAIQSHIAEVAAEVHTDVVNTTADVHKDEDYIEVQIGTVGIDLDQEALYDTVIGAILEVNFDPITFDYTETAYPAFDLSRIYQDLFTAVADAYYDAETHEIVEEQVGYGFDLAAANQKVAMAEDGDVIRIVLEEVQPKETKAHLEEIYFADELASFSTGNLGSYNRTTNVTLACEALNGTVLAPGEVFSYNQTVGQRTKERGFLEAGAYVSGKSVSEVGGGICQVSSTLYYCALLSNLEIVSRTNHMFTVGYVDLGMDATVSWPNPDFQFKNNTEYPIRIEANVSGGTCNISLIGTKTDNIQVKMTYEILATIPYTTVVTEDPSEVTSSGHTGYNVVTYRHLIDGDTGEEIDVILESYSYYQKSDIVVLKSTVDEEIDNRLDEEDPPEEETPGEGGGEGGETPSNPGEGGTSPVEPANPDG